MSMISLKNVSKFYRNKTTISSGFTKLNLDLDMGEFVVITGESGSGKSTFLNVISGLDSYEEGEMYINGEETSHYTEVDYENYRRKYIGNIFQHFNLVNSYTVSQNIELVLLLNGYSKKEAKTRALEIIETVGLTKYKHSKASKLSGGQKQRVAIARALAKDTPIIVADEPTGNLDVQSAKSIMKLLKDISKNKLVVIVTHNYEQVCDYATRKISMNDGKIIEDKKLQPFTKCEAEMVKYEDLTLANKIMLGIRNAFNIKTKFLLLFLVYFFLTLLVFSEYSGIEKQDFTSSLEGYNSLFNETSPERVLLNKKDKTAFSDSEVTELENLANIERVVTSDLLLDAYGNIFSENYAIFVSGSFKNVSEISEVDEGRMPSADNEIVIETSKDSSAVLFYKDDLFKSEFTLQDNVIGEEYGKVKVVGIVYSEDDDYYGKLYLSDSIIEKVSNVLNVKYNKMTLDVNGNERELSSYGSYNSLKPNANVKDGQVFVSSSLNSYCSNYNCLNQKIKVKTQNIYYEEEIDLSVAAVLDSSNFKALTGIANYDEYATVTFVSVNDYKKLLEKGHYQISVFLSDLHKSEETLKTFDTMGYDYYFMKDNLVNPDARIAGVIKIIRNVVFLIATGALFFICYFIIKIILKSRNVYFSTIRILGASKKISRSLLNIELFVDINVAFFVFVGLISMSKNGIIGWQYLRDLVAYFEFKDYVTVYLVLSLMSLLISNRYASKLFKDSVMNTYREEV